MHPAASASANGRLCLLAIGEQRFGVHWLPEAGEVTIGRAETCNIRVDEASLGQQHALIGVQGSVITLTDLGSPGGSKVRNAALVPMRPVQIAPGEVITLGSVMFVVQSRTTTPQRRIWSHGYFESRVEEECTRSERFKSSFALLRVKCDTTVEAAVVEDCLANVLRLVDTVGTYGPGDYEVLLGDSTPQGVQIVSDRIIAILSAKVGKVRVGVACYPRDGRTADVLAERAGASVLGVDATERKHDAEPALEGAMAQIDQLVERIASSTINVLILGETGVGKELVAERVHQLSPRAKKPFLGLNGAALSESLLESELFGHERGAFTGAVQAKQGLLETADGGTVFLDEVGELPMSIQVKLLRVLETRKVTRVGSLKQKAIDVRFVAATNRDLEAEVQRGTFRQDLFFRLNGISLMVPPLRDRVSEIQGLAETFITDACRKYGRPNRPNLSADALELMRHYSWPGNIRELRNVVERAVVVGSGDTLTLAHLPVEKMSASFADRTVNRLQAPRAPAYSPPHTLPQETEAAPPRWSMPSTGFAADQSKEAARRMVMPRNPGDLQQELRGLERQRIVDALAACAGNQTEAARMLGLSRRTFVNRLTEYGIARPRKRRPEDPPEP